MAGIGGDRDQRLGGGAEQDGVDGGLVVKGDRGDRRRQREHDVEVRDWQELGLALGEPLGAGQALTLWAVPVATGIVGDAGRPAVVALLDMAAQCRGPACRDRAHDAPLDITEVVTMGLPKRLAVGGGKCPPPRSPRP
jgi:hypothetical protein